MMDQDKVNLFFKVVNNLQRDPLYDGHAPVFDGIHDTCQCSMCTARVKAFRETEFDYEQMIQGLDICIDMLAEVHTLMTGNTPINTPHPLSRDADNIRRILFELGVVFKNVTSERDRKKFDFP